MNPRANVLLLAGFAALIAAATGCRTEGDAPALTAPDPAGKDLVVGAVVAATEKSGGVRLYKIVHVDDYPDPIGHEYHMIAYDPKVPSFEEAPKAWKSGGLRVIDDHVLVRFVDFRKRDRRVVAVEPVTDEERKPYLQSRR